MRLSSGGRHTTNAASVGAHLLKIILACELHSLIIRSFLRIFHPEVDVTDRPT